MSAEHPHDTLVKALFRDTRNIAAELRRLLPDHVIDRIDLSSVRLADGVSVDPKLRDKATDLWFEARFHGGQQGYIFMLYEHQSSVKHEMAWRMVDYMTRFWRDWIDAQKGRDAPAFPLPAIVPVVLYHGARRWTAPQHFVELLDLDDESRAALSPYLLQLRYRLEDLGALSQAELLEQTEQLPHMLGVAFLLMRAVVRSEDLLAILNSIRAQFVGFLRIAGPDEIQTIISYIENTLHRQDVETTLVELVEHADADEQEVIMETRNIYAQERFRSAHEQGLAEGHAEGLEQGHAEGLERGLEQGIEQGIEQGLEQGRLDAARSLLKRQMTIKFGALNEAIFERIDGASLETLQLWMERIITAQTAEELML